MATFGGASDAVAAAVAIQQAIDRHNRSGERGARWKCGSGSAPGTSPSRATTASARPSSRPPGSVPRPGAGRFWPPRSCGCLARSSRRDRSRRSGHLELKGLPGAGRRPCEVTWEPLRQSLHPAADLPDRHRPDLRRPGRRARTARPAVEGGGGGRAAGGAPGRRTGRRQDPPGRRAGRHRVHDEGATVLAGRCDEDLGVPYQPFVEALRHFVDHTPQRAGPPRPLRRGAGPPGPRARRAAAAACPPPLRSDPETERYRLFDAVAAWLRGVSADEPVLLVLDDLQWAAKPTLLLLRHVVRSAEPMRLLVLGTYRDTELGPRPPLVDAPGRPPPPRRRGAPGAERARRRRGARPSSSRPPGHETRRRRPGPGPGGPRRDGGQPVLRPGGAPPPGGDGGHRTAGGPLG